MKKAPTKEQQAPDMDAEKNISFALKELLFIRGTMTAVKEAAKYPECASIYAKCNQAIIELTPKPKAKPK